MLDKESIITKKTVLVTGGAGFIGSHTVDTLINSNFNVIVVDRRFPRYENKKARYYTFDINDKNFETVFQENKIDFVIHLAAQVSVSYSCANVLDDAKDNILSSINVLEMCKKYNVKKVVVSSSAAVYGTPNYLPVDEKHPVMYLSPYALSKHTMEEYVKYYGIDYVICRFSNVYGPRQDADGEAGVVAIFANKMFKNKSIEIHGDGNQIRDFVYVEDVAKAVVSILKSPIKNETINVSSNTKTTVNDLYCVLKDVLDYELKPIYTEPRIGDIRESILDNHKAVSLLNWSVKTDLKTGLTNTIKLLEKVLCH